MSCDARRHAAGGSACLDAETLGAWADGGLDAAAMAAVEAHVSTCARCQAHRRRDGAKSAPVPWCRRERLARFPSVELVARANSRGARRGHAVDGRAGTATQSPRRPQWPRCQRAADRSPSQSRMHRRASPPTPDRTRRASDPQRATIARSRARRASRASSTMPPRQRKRTPRKLARNAAAGRRRRRRQRPPPAAAALERRRSPDCRRARVRRRADRDRVARSIAAMAHCRATASSAAMMAARHGSPMRHDAGDRIDHRRPGAVAARSAGSIGAAGRVMVTADGLDVRGRQPRRARSISRAITATDARNAMVYDRRRPPLPDRRLRPHLAAVLGHRRRRGHRKRPAIPHLQENPASPF